MENKTYKKIGIIFIIIGFIFSIYSILNFNWIVLLGSIIMWSNGIKILYEIKNGK